jgi:hypothetical protein
VLGFRGQSTSLETSRWSCSSASDSPGFHSSFPDATSRKPWSWTRHCGSNCGCCSSACPMVSFSGPSPCLSFASLGATVFRFLGGDRPSPTPSAPGASARPSPSSRTDHLVRDAAVPRLGLRSRNSRDPQRLPGWDLRPRRKAGQVRTRRREAGGSRLDHSVCSSLVTRRDHSTATSAESVSKISAIRMCHGAPLNSREAECIARVCHSVGARFGWFFTSAFQ